MTMNARDDTSMPHHPTGAAGSRRLGVRGKLLLAFAGMAGMTVAASMVGLTSFSAVERPLTQIVGTGLPEMELAKRLSGESSGIAAAAPVLAAAESQSERERVYGEIMGNGKALGALVEELASHRSGDPRIGELRAKTQGLIATLERGNAAANLRLSVRGTRETMAVDLAKSYDAFLANLAPLTERAGATLRGKGETLDSSTERDMNSLGDAIRSLITMYEVRGDLGLASEALTRAGGAETAFAVTQFQQNYLEAAARMVSATAQVGSRLSKETSDGLDAFFLLGDGADGVFDMRRKALELPAGSAERDAIRQKTTEVLADAARRQATLLDQMESPLMRLKAEIKLSSVNIRSQTRDSMQESAGRRSCPLPHISGTVDLRRRHRRRAERGDAGAQRRPAGHAGNPLHHRRQGDGGAVEGAPGSRRRRAAEAGEECRAAGRLRQGRQQPVQAAPLRTRCRR